jgi:hypothetical protein
MASKSISSKAFDVLSAALAESEKENCPADGNQNKRTQSALERHKRERSQRDVEAEQKEAARHAHQAQLGDELDLRATIARMKQEITPKTGFAFSERELAALLGVDRSKVHRMLSANWTPKRGRPSLMPEHVFDVFADKVKEAVVDQRTKMTSVNLAVMARATVVAESAANGVDPPAFSPTSFTKHFRKTLKDTAGVSLVTKTTEERARHEACCAEVIYAGAMRLKHALSSLKPPFGRKSSPKGSCYSDQVIFMDETSMGADGSAAGNAKTLASCGAKKNGLPTDVSARHLTGAFAVSAEGHLISATFVLSGSEKIVDMSALPPRRLLLAKLVMNQTGSMESDKEGKGSMTEFVRGLAAKLDETLSPDDQKLLIIDNVAVHLEEKTLMLCREKNIFVGTLPPHTTSVTQVNDTCFINGNLKKTLGAMHVRYPDMATHPQFYLSDYENAIMATCTKLNIRNAVQACLMSYSPDFSLVRVVDSDVCAKLSTMLSQGVIYSKNVSAIDPAQMRFERMELARELAHSGTLPPHYQNIISVEALHVTTQALHNLKAHRSKHKSRRPTASIAAFTESGANVGTAIVNGDAQINAYRQHQLESVKLAEESKTKEAAKLAKKAEREGVAVARSERRQALQQQFPQVAEEQWQAWTRNLGKYFKGTWTLERAVARVNGLLNPGKPKVKTSDVKAVVGKNAGGETEKRKSKRQRVSGKW